MNQQMSNYQLLIEKLDQFIRKFYVNKLVRGALYSVGFIIASFLLFTIAEYFFYFGTSIRKTLFFGFFLISAVALYKWVGMPLIHYFKLGKIISHEQAAGIIGDHFTEVKDKLINILQLRKQAEENSASELVFASINQKTEEIKLVPFRAAIDLRKNKQYLPYALPPLLILLGILLGAPSIIKEPTKRILKNNIEFEKAAPFSFHIINPSLDVPQYEDFRIGVSVEGNYLPEQAFIVVNGFQYRLNKDQLNQFTYTFNNVQNNQRFQFSAEGITSKSYELNVLKKPNILDFETQLDYPSYTSREDEILSNVGDLVIPQGTKVDWVLQSVNTDAMAFQVGNSDREDASRLSDDTYTYSKRIYGNFPYKIIIGNEALPEGDSVSYSVTIIPDHYPTISLEQFVDSSDKKLLYLVGEASDDYGLTRLTFNYRITNKGESIGDLQVLDLNAPAAKRTGYDYIFDINSLELSPGDDVLYYFEVFDNDQVNGVKSTKTTLLKYTKPTIAEFEKQEDENEEDIKNTLSKAKKESEEIKNSFKELREKMLQEKNVDWQMKKELENLLNRQEDLDKELQDAKEKFEENLQNQQEFAKPSEEILEKQEKLKELFEELMDEDTQELMEKIQELLQELERDDALQMMENMEFNVDEMDMELERLMELFKQLELERDMLQQIDKLNELAEKEEELSKETEKTAEEYSDPNPKDDEQNNEGDKNETENETEKSDEQNNENESQNEANENQSEEKQEEGIKENEELTEAQEEINKAFEEIKKELEKLEQRNEEMKNPSDMGETGEQMEDINQDLQKSLEQLKQNQNKDAAKSQKNAAQKMQEAAQQMQQQMQQGEMEQMAEDLKAMRQLLENLVELSFDQEDLMGDFSKTHTSTPKYVELVQHQHKLEDDFHLIEDSLQALSQRVYQIESFVLEKVSDIKNHMDKSLSLLEDRKKSQASDHQQRTMKNVNDLALMFSESMQQMQQQMANMMTGQQMCTKPGGQKPKDGKGNVPLDKISEGQKDLNGQMRQMKEGKDKGVKEMTSKEFAQMAAKQAALRKALRDVQKLKQQQGKGSKELEKILQEMNKIETDLVNKRLTNEMLKRQKDILTRLLESERAEREREYENKRESETGLAKDRALPPSIEEYIKQREAQIEPFKTISPSLRPYYKQLVEEYYKSLKEN